ncbi:MAG: hypothetical protein AAGC88_14735 [Bacteroidota bacterium]
MSENAHSQFLGYLHSFRGFAIINIAMLHAVVATRMPLDGFELDFSEPMTLISHVLFGGSTLYFSVISGLLFTAILKSRGYPKFYRNKVRNVIFPYVFFK